VRLVNCRVNRVSNAHGSWFCLRHKTDAATLPASPFTLPPAKPPLQSGREHPRKLLGKPKRISVGILSSMSDNNPHSLHYGRATNGPVK
jgi:hypothetical protein